MAKSSEEGNLAGGTPFFFPERKKNVYEKERIILLLFCL